MFPSATFSRLHKEDAVTPSTPSVQYAVWLLITPYSKNLRSRKFSLLGGQVSFLTLHQDFTPPAQHAAASCREQGQKF